MTGPQWNIPAPPPPPRRPIEFKRVAIGFGLTAAFMVLSGLPQTSFATQALWYELGPGTVSPELPLMELLGALHAAEHSQIAVLPLLAMCDRWDIGGLSTNLHPQTGGPTIFIYDGHPGGIGITRRGYLAFEALVDDAHRLVSECPCADGCPSCVQSPKCWSGNTPLDKA